MFDDWNFFRNAIERLCIKILMYPASIPPIETTASGRGSWELELPTRAVSTNRLAKGSQG